MNNHKFKKDDIVKYSKRALKILWNESSEDKLKVLRYIPNTFCLEFTNIRTDLKDYHHESYFEIYE